MRKSESIPVHISALPTVMSAIGAYLIKYLNLIPQFRNTLSHILVDTSATRTLQLHECYKNVFEG